MDPDARAAAAATTVVIVVADASCTSCHAMSCE